MLDRDSALGAGMVTSFVSSILSYTGSTSCYPSYILLLLLSFISADIKLFTPRLCSVRADGGGLLRSIILEF